MPLRLLTGTVNHNDGTPWVGGQVTFILCEPFTTATAVQPAETQVVALDALGQLPDDFALSVPDTGTARYMVKTPDNLINTVYLAAGPATDLQTLITIAGSPISQNAAQTVIDAHVAAVNPHPQYDPISYVRWSLNKFGAAIVAFCGMRDVVGTAMIDAINNYNGVYNGPTLANAASIVLGETAPTFDGINDVVDVKTALDHLTASVAGSIMGWAKIDAAAWTDGAKRDILSFYNANGSDFIQFGRGTGNNQLQFIFTYGGVALTGQIPFSSTNWFSYCLTWDKAQNVMRLMVNGYNPYVDQTGLGVWTDNWYTGYCNLGGFAAGSEPHKGAQSNHVILNRLVTQAEFLAWTEYPDRLKKLTIIGDSIEAQWNQWPYTVAGARGYILKNHAVGGYGILAGGLALEVAAAAGDDADYIIIALGTNDSNSGDMTALQNTLKTNIDALRASNPRATMYYLNVLPKWTDNTGSTPVVMTNVRAAIAETCAAKNVPCWDTFTIPWITADQMTDGTHLTAAGNVAIVAQVLARLP